MKPGQSAEQKRKQSQIKLRMTIMIEPTEQQQGDKAAEKKGAEAEWEKAHEQKHQEMGGRGQARRGGRRSGRSEPR